MGDYNSVHFWCRREINMSSVINGRLLAKEFELEIIEEIEELAKRGIIPGLAVIVVGDDPASHTYIRGKAKAAERVGIDSSIYSFSKDMSESDLLRHIDGLNERDDVDGILVQLPLPSHIDERQVIERISPDKDVDGFHPNNVGKMLIGGVPCLLPCTPYGIMELIRRSGETIAGKHAVVVGRSNIVGKPIATLFLHEDATVTLCHSQTRNLASITRQADILVVAMGKPGFITEEFVNERMIVIDVGISRQVSGKLVGDIDFEKVAPLVHKITPVPGGVGPMTITMLMKNTVIAAKRRRMNG